MKKQTISNISMNLEPIFSRLHIEQLNAMQETVADKILHSHHDVVVLSPTGSGKTLAYLLPLVQRLDPQSEQVQAVVIVPGRELALQSASVLADMRCGLRGMAVYGGRAAMDEHRQMRSVRPHILFATPGRLNDHLEKENFSAVSVAWLVIDEFDKCLAMGFQAEMQQAISQLKGVRRRILLSATDAEAIPRFVNMSRTARLSFLDENAPVNPKVHTYIVNSKEKDKLPALSALLRSLGDKSSIVFLNYRDSVERTAAYLRGQGFSLSLFHGGLDQEQREAALYQFRNASVNVLVSTDLGSRGLDIPEVDHIIHYHLPLGADEYVHRVGRTARWESTGNTFFLLGPEEHLPEYVEGETETYEIPAELPAVPQPRMCTLYIGRGKKDKISKGDVVGFLCKTGGLTADEIGRIDIYERYTYVAVARIKQQQVLRLVKNVKIKGQRTVVEPLNLEK
jgi:superfamily II DNA/RNA helicase